MRRRGLFLIIFFILGSCQKKESTTTGNPITVNLKMTASQSTSPIAKMSLIESFMNFLMPTVQATPPPAMSDGDGNIIVLNQGWITVKEIEFKATEVAEAEESSASEIKLNGPYAVDLFSAIPHSIGDAVLNMSGVRRIKMKLHNTDSLPTGAPNELLNNSIYFSGTIANQALTFSSEEGTEFEIGGPNLISLHENIPLLITIKIVPLMAKMKLSHLLSLYTPPYHVSQLNTFDLGVSVCPTIDAGLTKVYDCFKKGLEQQANVGDDSNGDGELDDSESGVKN